MLDYNRLYDIRHHKQYPNKLTNKDLVEIIKEYSPLVKTWLIKNNVRDILIGEALNDIFYDFYNKFIYKKTSIRQFLFLITRSVINKAKKEVFASELSEDFDMIDDFAENIEYERQWTNRINELYNEIKQLPIKEKDIAISFFINNDKLKDIAEFQDMNINTVKSRIQKSKERLRNKDIYCILTHTIDSNLIKDSEKTLNSKVYIFKNLKQLKLPSKIRKYIKIKEKFYSHISNDINKQSTNKYLFQNFGVDDFSINVNMEKPVLKYGHEFILILDKNKLCLKIDNKHLYHWKMSHLYKKTTLEKSEITYALKNNKVSVSFKITKKKDYGTIIRIYK